MNTRKSIPTAKLNNPVLQKFHEDIDACMETLPLLSERATTHGRFDLNAEIAQEIKATMRATALWDTLSDPRKEALDFIASKIGRILSGKSDFADHWSDIAGYAELAKK